MSRYKSLSDELRQDLKKIPPSYDGLMYYYPCAAKMRDGQIIDRVYVADEISYISVWGAYPEEDHHKSWIKIEDVGALAESPSRIPAAFATELYQLGETRMGGMEFTVVYADGSEEFFLTGNAVDFIFYPPGKSAKDVVNVRRGGRGQPTLGPHYYWCLHSTFHSSKAV